MNSSDIVMLPLASLFATIGSYSIALWAQKKLGGGSYLNPVIIAIVLMVIYLVYFDIPYTDYLEGVGFINTLLGTATVALAIPLYKQISSIRGSTTAIILAVLSACVIAAISSYFLADYMKASDDIKFSIIPKSVTVPIAIGISEKIGREPSLAVFFVFTTGIIGSLIAPFIFRLFKIHDERSIGLSLGATCHGLGLVRAFQYSQKAGAFSAIGMSLMGIISGIILPIFILNILM